MCNLPPSLPPTFAPQPFMCVGKQICLLSASAVVEEGAGDKAEGEDRGEDTYESKSDWRLRT